MRTADKPIVDWAAIDLDYEEKGHAARHRDGLKCFKQQQSLISAIRQAARAQNHSEKRFSHQCRIRKSAIPEAEAALLASADRLASANSFHELLTIIREVADPIYGIGEVYCYDTALRIGAFRRLLPEERVYLHAGSREGAATLLDRPGCAEILRSDVPEPVRARPSDEIENILCIFKNRTSRRVKC